MRRHWRAPSGQVWALEDDGTLAFVFMAHRESPYGNLLCAAPLMFHVIDDTIVWADTLVGVMEQFGLDHLVNSVLEIQAGLAACRKAALDGLESLIRTDNSR